MIALAALLVGAALAGPWQWTDDGMVYQLEGELGFDEPVAMTTHENAPRVEQASVRAIARCVPGGRDLSCYIIDAHLKARASQAYWSEADQVLQEIQGALQDRSVAVRMDEDGRVRRVRPEKFEGDRQTGALHQALVESMFWCLDLEIASETGAPWVQRDSLPGLPTELTHTPAAEPVDGGLAVTLSGRDSSRVQVEGAYTFNLEAGRLQEASLSASLGEVSRPLIETEAYVITPDQRSCSSRYLRSGTEETRELP